MKTNRLYSVACIAAVLMISPALTFASNAKSEVQQAYYAWVKAMNMAKGNPKAVLSLYAPHAILLATLADHLKFKGKPRFIRYFKSITSEKDFSVKPQRLTTQIYGNTAINTGFYTFSYKSKGHKTVVPSRFTFVYEKMGGKWLIVNHHSSMLPTHQG